MPHSPPTAPETNLDTALRQFSLAVADHGPIGRLILSLIAQIIGHLREIRQHLAGLAEPPAPQPPRPAPLRPTPQTPTEQAAAHIRPSLKIPAVL